MGTYLEAVADAEYGYAQFEYVWIDAWGPFIVYRVRRTRKDDACQMNQSAASLGGGVELALGLPLEIFDFLCARHEFCVDVVFPTSSRNQMAVLCLGINSRFRVDYHHSPANRNPR